MQIILWKSDKNWRNRRKHKIFLCMDGQYSLLHSNSTSTNEQKLKENLRTQYLTTDLQIKGHNSIKMSLNATYTIFFSFGHTVCRFPGLLAIRNWSDVSLRGQKDSNEVHLKYYNTEMRNLNIYLLCCMYELSLNKVMFCSVLAG